MKKIKQHRKALVYVLAACVSIVVFVFAFRLSDNEEWDTKTIRTTPETGPHTTPPERGGPSSSLHTIAPPPDLPICVNRNERKLAVITIFKHETLTMKEWLDHYLWQVRVLSCFFFTKSLHSSLSLSIYIYLTFLWVVFLFLFGRPPKNHSALTTTGIGCRSLLHVGQQQHRR